MRLVEQEVLGAMLRLARRRLVSDEGAVAVRVGSTPAEVRVCLRRLRSLGLVQLTAPDATTVGLTLDGLAVAVALLPRHRSRARREASRQDRAA